MHPEKTTITYGWNPSQRIAVPILVAVMATAGFKLAAGTQELLRHGVEAILYVDVVFRESYRRAETVADSSRQMPRLGIVALVTACLGGSLP